MASLPVLSQTLAGVTTITLDWPERRNAFANLLMILTAQDLADQAFLTNARSDLQRLAQVDRFSQRKRKVETVEIRWRHLGENETQVVHRNGIAPKL